MVLTNILLMMGGGNQGHGGGNSISTIIMLLIIFLVPLSWVIPIIVKKTRKKPADYFRNDIGIQSSIKTPEQQTQKDFIYCPNCGKQYEAGHTGKFCSTCGSKL